MYFLYYMMEKVGFQEYFIICAINSGRRKKRTLRGKSALEMLPAFSNIWQAGAHRFLDKKGLCENIAQDHPHIS